jgi:hypothetical protein
VPRGQYERKPKEPKTQTGVLYLTAEEAKLEARIAEIERRLEVANERFAKGYVGPI